MEFIGMDEIMPIAKTLIDAERPTWGVFEHVSLVARVSILALAKADEMKLDADATRIFLCKTLDQHGLAGNSSQFRQYLIGKELLSKTETKNRGYK